MPVNRASGHSRKELLQHPAGKEGGRREEENPAGTSIGVADRLRNSETDPLSTQWLQSSSADADR